jgi:hypothetical protein
MSPAFQQCHWQNPEREPSGSRLAQVSAKRQRSGHRVWEDYCKRKQSVESCADRIPVRRAPGPNLRA